MVWFGLLGIVLGPYGGAAHAADVGSEIDVGSYRAVLLSAADYAEDSGIPDLETPNQDIQQIGELLERRYGFEVERFENAKRGDIVYALDELARTTGHDDVVVIYYAGHGQFDEAQGVGYWLPTDARVDDRSTWLANSQVQDSLRALRARHVLLIIDACFSGEFARERGIEALLEDDAGWPGQALAKSLAGTPSRVYLSSGGNEVVSDQGPPPADGEGPPTSVFAYFLEQLLESTDQRYVLPSRLLPPLRQRVYENASQTPRLGVVANTNHQGGELVLINLEAEACEEGAAGCLGDVAIDTRPPAWRYDPQAPAFRDDYGLRVDKRVAGGLLVAGGVVAGVTSVVVGAAAARTRRDYRSDWNTCISGPVIPDCAVEVDESAQQVRYRQQVAAAVGLGVGAIGLLAGGTVTFTLPSRAQRLERQAEAR